MENLSSRHRLEALDAARAHVGPGVLVAVDLNNFKAWNGILGHAAGDQVLVGVERSLQRVGRAWRVGGNRFVALVDAGLEEARRRVRAFTWLHHARVGATEAWEFCFTDGRPAIVVPRLAIEVICNPRVGLAELAEMPDVEQVLALADQRCDRAAADPALHAAHDFAPIVRQPWNDGRRLALEACPLCSSEEITQSNADLGECDERCDACLVSYRRVNRTYVLGRDEAADWV